LTAAVAASPADRYDDRGGDAAPWWANSSTQDTTTAQPKVPEYLRPIGDAGSKSTVPSRSAYPRSGSPTAGVAEVAADPPADHPNIKDGVASFGDRPTSESGVQMPVKTPIAPGNAAPALLRHEVESPPDHLASATESPAAPVKRDYSAAGPSLESTNVLRPPPAPAVVATAATSPAPAMPAPPRPIPVPSRALATNAPPPAAMTTTATSPASTTADSVPSLALGGHADKGILGKTSPLTAMFTVGGSLSIVLGLFLVVAWAMRKTAPRGSLRLPKEVFEILGRAPLGARQQVQLLRCGSKLLLVSITPHGTETLTEVTDPLEVDRIAGICQQGNPKSSTAAFRQVFQQVATKPGAAERDDLDLGPRRKRYRWEKEHA
jgi:flagellar biogenesis protein FliO